MSEVISPITAPVLRIPHDRAFDSGPVEFDGDVTVDGGVPDGARLRAGGGITVTGGLGAADVECGGDLFVDGGMMGREDHTIRVRGNARARFINNVVLEGAGDLAAGSEILNSRIRVRGRVTADSIVGGLVYARRGIEMESVGSPLTVATQLQTGVDARIEDQTRRTREDLKHLRQEIAAIAAQVAPFLKDQALAASLTPARRADLRKTLVKLKEMKRQAAESDADLAQNPDGTSVNVRAVIRVRRMIYTGVTAQIGWCSLTFRKDQAGPVRLVADVRKSVIRIENDTPPPEAPGA